MAISSNGHEIVTVEFTVGLGLLRDSVPPQYRHKVDKKNIHFQT